MSFEYGLCPQHALCDRLVVGEREAHIKHVFLATMDKKKAEMFWLELFVRLLREGGHDVEPGDNE